MTPKKQLEHCCKGTCSGWKDGFEQGELKWRTVAKEMEYYLTCENVKPNDIGHFECGNCSNCAAMLVYRKACEKSNV